MLSPIALAISAIISVCAAFLIFRAREMTHAMVGFLIVSISTGAVLAILGLPLLALMQLFIMVGGVSTYLFVGVSSENLSRFRHTSFPILVVLAIALAAVPIYKVLTIGIAGGPQNSLSGTSLAYGISGNIVLFYMLAIMLFGIGIGSIVMMRKSKGASR